MSGTVCRQPGCAGVIEDGYCTVCGLAEKRGPQPGERAESTATASTRTTGTARIAGRNGTGSTPVSRAVSRSGAGLRRVNHASSRTTRKQLGAGLISLPDLPSIEPERAILLDPVVPERKRFCAKCEAPLKRETGFCGKCGTKYSFVPGLRAGDVVANQYEVRGAIAYGGLGWIYLGFDRLLSRYVVLKGLLNAQDASAAAAAVAERQFLAAVKHPNIVGIYNFVQVGTEGYIVMEYVGGKTLKQIRQERGPLPVAEALAYIHRMLPAFAYLHRMGLVYCDFKPDNMMLERDDIKLIDLGGVRRIDDVGGDIYGTVGYSAPEAGAGPTPASDLYTIGRTLAVLLTDIRGFTKDHRYTLPDANEEPRFAGQESLYRLLLKSTAQAADDRFEDALEMAEQTLGVMREVVAVETGVPRSSASAFFGPDQLAIDAGDAMQPVTPDPGHLPQPAPDAADEGVAAVSGALVLGDRDKRMMALRLAAAQFPRSREARLRLAGNLAEGGAYSESTELLRKLAEEDAWDWRVLWMQARVALGQGAAGEAQRLFDQVYFDLPGELAPKLALGLAAELAGDLALATKMYELVARTDPGYGSAVFGLARCLLRTGQRGAAVEALNRIASSSALYIRAQVGAARMLVEAGPKLEDLTAASGMAQRLQLTGISRVTLRGEILQAAVEQVRTRAITANPSVEVCGAQLEESRLREELERVLRESARYVTPGERVAVIDRANQMRPRTLF